MGSYDLELPLLFDEINPIKSNKEPELTDNAITVLRARYLKKNLKNEVVETPREMFHRVASTVSIAELQYGDRNKMEEYAQKFYDMMVNLVFLPNSPTLMNAGRDEGQLSACFVLPVGDSMPEIFDAVKQAALIQKSGGGVGYSFSRLRPAGDRVRTTNGVSSGPISFMRVFNQATETVKQGGRRRGANMGVLRIDHPDILDFIDAKLSEGDFYNFNISVAITDEFMDALKNNSDYDLYNPRSGKKSDSLKASTVWDKIVTNAWKNAEPGILFLDRINSDNPTPKLGRIESTNPCGEACLLPFEACNLGSINLSRFVKNRSIDYAHLAQTVKLAVRFLDNVIDVNEYVPQIPKIKQKTRGNRKIGLGIMGFADMLILLGISYKDEFALKIADRVMEFISKEGRKASNELAKERGCFPNWGKSTFFPATTIRNATITSIAPTGTLSIIAGCSPGIEPLFGVCFERNVLGDKKLLQIHPTFEEMAKKEGFYSKDLVIKLARTGTIQNFDEIPEHIRKLFVTSHDIAGERHVLIQASFQKHVDMSVSKTINLPANATKEDVGHIYMMAHRNNLKGITVYRDGSREGQVIVMGDSTSGQDDDIESDEATKSVCVKTDVENGNTGTDDEGETLDIPMMTEVKEIVCHECGQGTILVGACSVCQHCGYSKCG
ncbi:MAG: adenosylcobalamin-dependent ribonucleoside-diphosphate reductase [Candidatus Eremiobacteraeota bacterium]|nr:adenosylcobalamin-dependent ribonucleoside-diphosphate reductase [Candidatus Eremiobacteraeota bacterium]